MAPTNLVQFCEWVSSASDAHLARYLGIDGESPNNYRRGAVASCFTQIDSLERQLRRQGADPLRSRFGVIDMHKASR